MGFLETAAALAIAGGDTTLGDSTTYGLFSQKEQQIVFYHQWSQTVLSFKAFLTQYNENWSNNWEEQSLVRRFNKQYTFNNVQRSINLGWDLPAYDFAEAKKNLENCSMFVRMMYPKVDEHGATTGMNPIWYMSLMNFVHNSAVTVGGTGGGTSALGMSSVLSEGLAKTGLKGFPSNFQFAPALEEGFFEATEGVVEDWKQAIGLESSGKTKTVPNAVYPKLIRVSMDYTPIFDESLKLGWQEGEADYLFGGGSDPVVVWSGGSGFPWGEDPQISTNVASGMSGMLGGDADFKDDPTGGVRDTETGETLITETPGED